MLFGFRNAKNHTRVHSLCVIIVRTITSSRKTEKEWRKVLTIMSDAKKKMMIKIGNA